jgi:ribulose-phosphate 3-epimerase
MIKSPERYVDDFADAGADGITVHAEACVHLDRVLDQIHDRGLKTGIALNPATSLSVLDYVCEKADMILLMTVNPGFGGQKLIPGTLAKISQLRAILDQKGLSIPIEVDGGVNDETIDLVIEAGAHVIVAGSAVFGGEIGQNYRKLTAHFPQSV